MFLLTGIGNFRENTAFSHVSPLFCLKDAAKTQSVDHLHINLVQILISTN